MPNLAINDISLFYDVKGDGDDTVAFLNGVAMSTERWAAQTPFFSKNYCIFRPKSSTHSGANRPPIPIELVHPFRGKSSTDSGPNRPSIPEQFVRGGCLGSELKHAGNNATG